VAPRLDTAEAADTAETIRHGGLRREYELHVPSSYSGQPAALVVVLHGGGGRDDLVAMIKELTRFNAKADAEGFLVLYPKAIENYWNDGREVGRYRSHVENVDDVGFISELVDHVAARTAIDRGRVYATGASNGAMMAYRLACERPDRFVAVAAVAGNLPVGLPCRPTRPVSVLVMNGTEDPLMPWEGGEVRFGAQRLGEVLSAEQTVARWVAFNGCHREPAVEILPDRAPLDGTRVSQTRYARCDGGADVLLYRVEGGGHTWPGGPQETPRNIVGRTSRDVDATDVIWRFFSTESASDGPEVTPSAAFGPFAAPRRIEIHGYDGNAMEPSISKDGQVLVFNDASDRGPDKNLFWARRVEENVFHFMGPIPGVNTPAVQSSPSMDVQQMLYFTSLRDYPRNHMTLYSGSFVDGRLSDVRPLSGDLYRRESFWASLDPDPTPDGQTLYFVQGRFGGSSGPQEMDLRVARKAGAGLEYQLEPDDILGQINTAERLEYAPAISPDNLELFFTRAERSSGRVIAVHIYRAVRSRVADPFGAPEAIGAISGFVEAPSLSSDGRSLYYHKKDGDRFFVYRVTREETRPHTPARILRRSRRR
jgi:polyhydroxybutyrate depolymerase